MTAATAPARPAPRARALPSPAGPARLLRIELRRSAMLWLLPLLAVLFYISAYRPAMDNPPFWNIRSAMLQSHAMLVLAPLLAGAGAWTGSRDGRRGMADLIGMTAAPRWAGQLAAWAAATIWAEALYLAGVAVLYGVTADQGAWGGPLWWPVAVGAATVAASIALGFAAGTCLPGRFTAGLAAVAVFLALAGGAFAIQDNAVYAQIWPLNVQGPFPSDSYGIFYPYLPDLAIAQVIFLAGLAAVALGALGLRARAGGRWLRGAAAAVTAAGLVAAGTGTALAGTARLTPHGMVIRALHDAASDRPVPYTPVCSRGGIPVCLQPAYRAYLPAVTAALAPALEEVAGLPGAPVRITQVAVTSVQKDPGNGISFGGAVLSGSPPVVHLPFSGLTLPGEGGTTTADFTLLLRSQVAAPVLNALVGLAGKQGLRGGGPQGIVVGGPPQSSRGTMAQLAVAAALAKVAGLLSPAPPGARTRPGGAVLPGARVGVSVGTGTERAAFQRFAALPAAARHAWLVTHLASLRAGRITLSEIP